MRKILLSCFALNLGMIASAALAEPAADRIPGPTRLTESQMDTVTAGGITVVSSATASGFGSSSAYAAVTIYGESTRVFLGDGPSVFCYSLHAYPELVIKMDSNNIGFSRHFSYF